jgi:hypothetical protein
LNGSFIAVLSDFGYAFFAETSSSAGIFCRQHIEDQLSDNSTFSFWPSFQLCNILQKNIFPELKT